MATDARCRKWKGPPPRAWCRLGINAARKLKMQRDARDRTYGQVGQRALNRLHVALLIGACDLASEACRALGR